MTKSVIRIRLISGELFYLDSTYTPEEVQTKLVENPTSNVYLSLAGPNQKHTYRLVNINQIAEITVRPSRPRKQKSLEVE